MILNQLNLCKGGKSLVHSINLSILDLEDKKFLQFLRTEISSNSIDPNRLIFEITETAAVRNLDLAVNFIRELRAMGCSFSLDDFGAGFTSFRYLKEMEVDYIKIDGSLIRNWRKTSTTGCSSRLLWTWQRVWESRPSRNLLRIRRRLKSSGNTVSIMPRGII